MVDLGDATLLPGLIDIHQHLAFDASEDPVGHLIADDDATLLLRMRVAALRALAGGVTTIRDLGDRNYVSLTLREWFRMGAEVGPEILASGPPITVTGGHCWFLGGEADGVQGVRHAVQERVERGVDVIKIMATGGNLTPTLGPHESQYGAAELTAAVDAAHAYGLKIAAHAHGGQGIADAMTAGVDSIEHCTFFSADGVDADPEVIAELGRRQAVVSVTGGTLPGSTPPFPAMARRLDAIRANHGALHRAGARMVCGTDAGVGPNKPHDVLRYGVSAFPEFIGMTNIEALRANTSVAADACGLGHRKGTIEIGKDADLLAVVGDPLDDITHIQRVLAVFVRGNSVSITR
ncbi:MAG TPA: amidohydrolase family protein [Acidimicrobiia bacterium]|nr:amidohydrolase family protein [Acidimicrobiia bacterium]